jgi:uncharacterized protein YggE
VQAIERPFGVSVFGSAMVRVEPDLAEVELGVGRIAKTAAEAFRATREGVAAVRDSLRASGLTDESVEVSRVTLESLYEGMNRRDFKGYRSYVSFRVLITRLDGLEATVSAAVEAGANEVQRVSYQASQLLELRAQARRNAIRAARAKAEIYCQAAEVRVGNVVHIEDVNPDYLMMRGVGHMGVGREIPEQDDSAVPGMLESGSLIVSAAVTVGFTLLHD